LFQKLFYHTKLLGSDENIDFVNNYNSVLCVVNTQCWLRVTPTVFPGP